MTLLTDQVLWQQLAAHSASRQGTLASLSRPPVLSVAGLTVDFSQTHLDEKMLSLWLDLAQACDLSTAIERLFSGGIVNVSEQRAAWHTILRDPPNQPDYVKVAMEKIAALSTTMVESGVTDIIHIGIGGSYLGPALLRNAFAAIKTPAMHCHFVANQNAAAIERLLAGLNPATTLVVIVSKSFTTPETITNAKQVLPWLKAYPQWQHRLIAVTAAAKRAHQMGVLSDHIFPLWDWLGGRYSVWSAVSISVIIAYGWAFFSDFLMGAHEVDQHFRLQPWSTNIPVLMALVGLTYRHFFNAQTQAIIPYCSSLSRLSGYLQQLHMESLGKQVTQSGQPIDYPTGSIIWGGTGPGSQHSFHQQLLQGRDCVPIDFIAVKADSMAYQACLHQIKAFSVGNGHKLPSAHQVLPGNKPCTLISMSSLTAKQLGALLALYEHKVYTQSVIWDINAFDQWGVEAGKQLTHHQKERIV
jgi:glucose-6-phosphate isomerase